MNRSAPMEWVEEFEELRVRYNKVACVGKGTYGSVYKAHLLGQPGVFYALKKIQLHRSSEGFPFNSLREIKILQNLDHPNVVKLYSIMTSKSKESLILESNGNKNRRSTFLVFEYVEHDFVSLFPHVDFDMAEVKCLMKQLLDGIAYIHSKDVLHRDLKSGNLLLNNKGILKICDFGLARYNYESGRQLTSGVATLWYRAPELIYGEKKYTNKIDVWSVGCIFAEMLTRKVLFKSNGQNQAEQIQCIYEKLGEPCDIWPEVKSLEFYQDLKPKKKYIKTLQGYIKQLNPKVDAACIDLLDRMVAYNPKDRLSASAALEHPWFSQQPRACHPSEIKNLEKEYHEHMIKEIRYKKRNEQLERERVEQERERLETKKHPFGDYGSKSQKREKKPDRLSMLLGAGGSTKEDSSLHKRNKPG